MIDLSLELKNTLVVAYLSNKGNIALLEQCLKNPECDIIIGDDEQFLIHDHGKVLCSNRPDRGLVKSFTNEHPNASIVTNITDYEFWEDQGFIIDRSKYRLINEDINTETKLRVPMKYEGSLSEQTISINHKLINDHRKQIKRRTASKSFSKDELCQLDKYLPGMGGAKKSQLYDKANQIKNMIGNGSNFDVNSIISSLKQK